MRAAAHWHDGAPRSRRAARNGNAALEDGRTGLLTADGARLPAYVIPTDEELLIARDTVRVVG